MNLIKSLIINKFCHIHFLWLLLISTQCLNGQEVNVGYSNVFSLNTSGVSIAGYSDLFIFNTSPYSGGIFLKVIETARIDSLENDKMVAKVGYEYSQGLIGKTQMKIDIDENGYAFLPPPPGSQKMILEMKYCYLIRMINK